MTRNRIVLGVFLVLVLGGAFVKALLEPRRRDALPDPRASVANVQPRGARALYLWLRAFGYETRTLRRPLTSLEPAHDTLFVLAPTQDVTPAQAESLYAWVAAGGTLFLAPGAVELDRRLERWVTLDVDDSPAQSVRGDWVVPDEGTRWRYRTVRPDEDVMFTYPVADVAIAGPGRVCDPAGEYSLLLARDGFGLVAELVHGDGTIVVFAEADLLTNRGLDKASNVELVASLVTDWVPPGTTIWFDEYDHGGRVAGSLLLYLARGRPGLLVAALLVTGVLALARFARALTRRPESARRRRREPAEFVAALGGLYARMRAVDPAWTALAATGERILRGDLAGGAIATLPDAERRRRRRALRTALAAGVSRREHASAPTERTLMRLARAVAACLGPARTQPAPPARKETA